MRVALGTFFLLSTFVAFSSDCEALDSSTLEKWKDYFDVIIEGHFEEVLHPDSDQRELLNQREQGGTNILFRVTRILKGPTDLEIIAILQFNEGNCTEFFENGSNFLVFGQTTTKVVCQKEAEQFTGNYSPPPPPPPGLTSERLYTNDCEEERLNYWNMVTEQQLTVVTNMCLSFPSNSSTGKLVKNSF